MARPPSGSLPRRVHGQVRDDCWRGVATPQHVRQRLRRLTWRTHRMERRTRPEMRRRADALFSAAASAPRFESPPTRPSRLSAVSPRSLPLAPRTDATAHMRAAAPTSLAQAPQRATTASSPNRPNSTGWARRCSMSEDASPAARKHQQSMGTLPRSKRPGSRPARPSTPGTEPSARSRQPTQRALRTLEWMPPPREPRRVRTIRHTQDALP